ncbi:hypothetical protein L2E82_32931 [Cichorium intybus]|uniref:Uncharacterized protein n=1 Tax=Cichorium intybus TaxID=13427 RepID=A0ACB9BHD9_CICIN|nr:hypothetical protein L2E82_32931 [Cichorium intybus]
MESEIEQPAATVVKWCDCGSDCCSAKLDNIGPWIRTTKRKLDERDDNKFIIPGLSIPEVARVDIGNECAALREMVTSQQQTIQDLSDELEEERNAASSAANEAMSMILRLQSEKAEVQMEARQFKRFSEERMAHDQQEIMELEDCLYQREQTIQALTCEVHAYKHRMLSFGLTESEAEGDNNGLIRINSSERNLDTQFELPAYNYPPLKCSSNEHHDTELDNETIDIEERIDQLERSPKHSPVREIYTVDSVHNAGPFENDPKAKLGTYDDLNSARSESSYDIKDTEVKKLYARLHSLEADRESMKQALISMRTDKAQLVLLKEIAQHLYKDMSPPPTRRMPVSVKKPSIFQKFSFLVLFKWITSFLFWRRRARRSKYVFGMSASNAGLRMVIDKGPQVGQWRCLSRTRFLKY